MDKIVKVYITKDEDGSTSVVVRDKTRKDELSINSNKVSESEIKEELVKYIMGSIKDTMEGDD